jgi:hypothetical protein
MMNIVNICVNGSRGFNDPELLDKRLRERIPNGQERFYRLVLGGAKGADTLAFEWAKKNAVETLVIKPDWNLHGKRAGILRNIVMIDLVEELISFWDKSSPGTKHAIEYAKSKGIKVNVIEY